MSMVVGMVRWGRGGVVALVVGAWVLSGVPFVAEARAAAPGDPPCTISGTPRADLLRGTAGDDVICGKGGDDQLMGLGGRQDPLGCGGTATKFGSTAAHVGAGRQLPDLPS